jgi:hypothetical protein
MGNVFFALGILLALGGLIVFYTVGKIKRARQVGKKLSKRNLYYALVTKYFVRDLPD